MGEEVELFWSNGDKVGSRIREGTTPDDYRDAVAGIGPLAYDWQDKPHRLVYDLAGELKRLQLKYLCLLADKYHQSL
jgi:hypothetical protein